MRLTYRRVTSPDDLESVRVIRNSCREFMTNDTYEISRTMQTEWFRNMDHDKTRVFVFLLDGSTVGYGILRDIADRWWCSGGLLPEHRDKGLGAELFGILIDACPSDELWLNVLIHNERASSLYLRLGFEIYDNCLPVDRLTIMRHRRNVPRE